MNATEGTTSNEQGQIDRAWAARVEAVCDLVGLEAELRPAVRLPVLDFLEALYLLRVRQPTLAPRRAR
jgi:hypothetical protein